MNENNEIIKKSDKYIPYYIVLFFVVVACVDAVFVTLALSTHRGVVSDKSYETGLDYNRVIEQAEAQQKLNWRSDLLLSDNTLALTLTDQDGLPIRNAKVNATAKRPTQEGYDFELVLQERLSEYVYSTDVAFPMAGEWEVRAYISKDSQSYQTVKRFIVEP